MSGAVLNSKWLTFEGVFGVREEIVLKSVRFHGKDFDQKIAVASNNAALDLIRRSIVQHTLEIAQQHLSSKQALRHADAIYYAEMGGLTLEDLFAQRHADQSFEVRYRVTRGALRDLFYAPAAEKSFDTLSDVFIPLTNLASYLRAMNEVHDAAPTGQALELTADRIDEFLLAFGQRLRADGDDMGAAVMRA